MAMDTASIETLSTVPRVAGSSAMDSNGVVWTWERDFLSWEMLPPVQVVSLSNVTELASRTALRNDGTVWYWRQCCCDNYAVTGPTQVSNLSNITAIANGVALRNDGTVWVWNVQNESAVAVQVQNLSGVTAIAEDTALRSDGTVWTWNFWGQNTTATQISNLTNVTAITEQAVLRSDGTVWAWGTDWNDNPVAPRQVSNLSNITAISFGTALRADGTVWQFRMSKLMSYPETEAMQVNVSNITAIGTGGGGSSATALRNDGYVWDWNPVFMWYYDGESGNGLLERVIGQNGVGFLNLNAQTTQPEPPDSPQPPTTPQLPITPFVDVNSNAWYAEGVLFVFENNIMQGISPTRFAPANNFSREQVVATLFRMNNGRIANASDPTTTPFNDVSSEAWYSPYIAWAHSRGIVTGTSSTTFGTGNAVSRQDFAVMMYRFANFQALKDTQVPEDFTLNFPDANIVGSWAEDGLKWAVHNGLITGTGQLLNPAGTASRGQAATILMRYVQTVTD